MQVAVDEVCVPLDATGWEVSDRWQVALDFDACSVYAVLAGGPLWPLWALRSDRASVAHFALRAGVASVALGSVAGSPCRPLGPGSSLAFRPDWPGFTLDERCSRKPDRPRLAGSHGD